MQLIPASIQRSTTSLRFFMNAAMSSCLSGPSYGLISAADPIILSMRFQCPPMHTAETHRPVLPSRRYSIWGLKLRVLLTSSVTVSMEKLLVAGNPTDTAVAATTPVFTKPRRVTRISAIDFLPAYVRP